MNKTITISCWIARDSKVEINLFDQKPLYEKEVGRFGSIYWPSETWFLKEFLNITRENSPVKCEITIKTNNK